jgi:hypothetical protein
MSAQPQVFEYAEGGRAFFAAAALLREQDARDFGVVPLGFIEHGPVRTLVVGGASQDAASQLASRIGVQVAFYPLEPADIERLQVLAYFPIRALLERIRTANTAATDEGADRYRDFFVASSLAAEDFCRLVGGLPIGFPWSTGDVALLADDADARAVLVAASDATAIPALEKQLGRRVVHCPVDAAVVEMLFKSAYPPIQPESDEFARATTFSDHNLSYREMVVPVGFTPFGDLMLGTDKASLPDSLIEMIPAPVIPRRLARDEIKVLLAKAYTHAPIVVSSEPLQVLDRLILDMMRANGASTHINSEVQGGASVGFMIYDELVPQNYKLEDNFPEALLNAALESLNRPKVKDYVTIAVRRSIGGHDIDLRIASSPIKIEAKNGRTLGNSIVVRVASERTMYTLERFGFLHEAYLRIKRLVERPKKLVFIVAPSGEAKTSLLRAIYRHLRKLYPLFVFREIGFPIERVEPGLRSTEIVGRLDAQTVVDQFMMMEPKVAIVPEMRDRAMFEVALDVAGRVHKTFGTSHWLSAPDAVVGIANKVDFSVTFPLQTDSIIGIRLVQIVCRCATERTFCDDAADGTEQHYVDGIVRNMLETHGLPVPGTVKQRRLEGCALCRTRLRGVAGQRPVVEVLEFTPALRDAVIRREFTDVASHDPNYVPMTRQACQLLIDGHTTPEELYKKFA